MHSGPTNPAVARLVERQMRNWEIAKTQRPAGSKPPAQVADFICLSYAIGTPGPAVAECIAERLGWPFFDREVLWEMAGDDQIRCRLYESLDEHDLTWFEDTMRALDFEGLHGGEYFSKLCATVLKLARKGPAIFLGRATDLILPRDHGFRARLSAPRSFRLVKLASETGVDLSEADRLLTEIETDRQNFVRRHFRADPSDASRFDIVLNGASFGIETLADLILTSRRMRGSPAAMGAR